MFLHVGSKTIIFIKQSQKRLIIILVICICFNYYIKSLNLIHIGYTSTVHACFGVNRELVEVIVLFMRMTSLIGLLTIETGSEDDGLLDLSDDDFFLTGSSSDEADADDEWTDKSTRYSLYLCLLMDFIMLFKITIWIHFLVILRLKSTYIHVSSTNNL